MVRLTKTNKQTKQNKNREKNKQVFTFLNNHAGIECRTGITRLLIIGTCIEQTGGKIRRRTRMTLLCDRRQRMGARARNLLLIKKKKKNFLQLAFAGLELGSMHACLCLCGCSYEGRWRCESCN